MDVRGGEILGLDLGGDLIVDGNHLGLSGIGLHPLLNLFCHRLQLCNRVIVSRNRFFLYPSCEKKQEV